MSNLGGFNTVISIPFCYYCLSLQSIKLLVTTVFHVFNCIYWWFWIKCFIFFSFVLNTFFLFFNIFNNTCFCADLLYHDKLRVKIRAGILKDRLRIWSLPDWEYELGSRQPPHAGHCQEHEGEKPTLARGNAITTSNPVSVCVWVGGLGWPETWMRDREENVSEMDF